MKKVRWFIVTLILAGALLPGCQPATVESDLPPPPEETVEPDPASHPGGQVANPASAYCEEQGYELEIRTAEDGGQYGICVFPDGSECEEWAFFRDECRPESDEGPAIVVPDSETARDAALVYLASEGVDVPLDAEWNKENVTPEDLVGSATLIYTAGAWQVTVDYPIAAPDERRYDVLVENPESGFRWEGVVDAMGQVIEGPPDPPGA